MSNRIITSAICLLVLSSSDAFAEDISPLKLLLEAKPQEYTAPADNNINAIDTPAVKLLRQLPAVAKVDVRGADKTINRIIHLQDWHLVTKDVFAADLRDVSDDPVTDEEIDKLYDEFLLEVAQVQSEPKAMLRCLIKHHGLRQVFVESIADRDIPILKAQVRVLHRYHDKMRSLLGRYDNLKKLDPDADAATVKEQTETLLHNYMVSLLRIGAAGQLMVTGELDEILPVEDAEAYDAANPVGDDGTVTLDEAEIEARQDAQVRQMLKREVAVVILGGAHDLADNIERLSVGKDEYVRVEVEAWKKVARE